MNAMERATSILAALLWASLAGAQTSAPAADAAQGPAAKAMAELFAQDDPASADTQQRAVLAAAGNDVGKLKALIAADVAYEALPVGWSRHTLKIDDGKQTYDMEFHIRVPNGYDGKKPLPLMVICHAQHSTGLHDGRMMERRLGERADDFVMLAHTLPGPEVYNAQIYQELACLKPLAYVRTHLNIDDDRVYLTGYSLGGHQTWHLATMYSHLWAAAVSMAGVPWFEGSPLTTPSYLPNLAPLPLWAIWGQNDRPDDPEKAGNVDLCRQAAIQLKALKNTNFTGTEIAGAGHGECWPPTEAFLNFLDDKKRVTPLAFEHCFHLPQHARGYFVEAVKLGVKPLDLTQPIRVPSEAATTQAAREAAQEFLAKKLVRLSVRVDRAANAVTIRAPLVRTVRLYLLDGLLDLSKPVHLNYLGRSWQGRLTPSAECILKHYAATRDQKQLVLNEYDLEVGGRVTPRYK
jgi:dienelactone hydrolase